MLFCKRAFRIFLFTILVMVTHVSFSQGTIFLRGSVIDVTTGEAMAFANIAVDSGITGGTSTDEKGKFTMMISRGTHHFHVSYIGFSEKQIILSLVRDTSVVFEMKPSVSNLKELVIEGERFYGEDKVTSTEMSTISLDRKQIQMIPNIAGEQDIIKVVQLLPGVSKGIEGAGDFFVRGGDADQNLLLLDGATIYNTGHLFGFVSVFNPDVIGEATFIKGAFPASYGGRLSSILDIRTRSDVPEERTVEGSIGIISSRLTIREPLQKDKMVLMISARRTYIDRVLDFINSDVIVPYYFYDVNGKLDYAPDAKNKLFISAYLGADILDYSQPTNNDASIFKANFSVNNNSQSIGWQYLFSEKTFGQLLVSRSFYDYKIYNSFFENEIRTASGIEDYTFQYEVKRFVSNSLRYSVGTTMQHHAIDPIVINSQGLIENFLPSSRSNSLSFSEGGTFMELEKDLTTNWKLNAGYRQSYAFVQNSSYTGFEPRISLRYSISKHSSAKAGYSRMTQYMHRVSSSAVTLPVDLWYGVTDDIQPQSSNQWVLGYVASLPSRRILFEAETYYKDMRNITEYAEGTNLILNTDFESSLLQGEGHSYGVETMIKKEGKNWQATLAYTLNWSNRLFAELNEGKQFPAKYDRRHNASVVGSYEITKRLVVSAVWEFISGSRFTPVIGQYSILNPTNTGVDVLYIYTDRNKVRLADTHRMDLMLIFKSKQDKKFKSEWHLGVYNVYNRATPIAISIIEDANGGYKYEQPGIFGTIPTISYHFKF